MSKKTKEIIIKISYLISHMSRDYYSISLGNLSAVYLETF